VPFTLVAFLGTLNHQTSAFAGLIRVFMWGLTPQSKPTRAPRRLTAWVSCSALRSTALKFLFPGKSQDVGYIVNGRLRFRQFFGSLGRRSSIQDRSYGPYSW
jgi:hypothetical protein